MTKPRPQVGITGLGAITCLGRGAAALWNGVESGRSGIENGLGRVADQALADLPIDLQKNRALAFAVATIDESMQQAGWSKLNPDDGLIVATTTGLYQKWNQSFAQFVRGQQRAVDFLSDFRSQPLGELTAAISEHYAHTGPVSLVSSACSASTQALAMASMWLRQKRVKRCLVVGVEVLCDLTVDGFKSLQLLSENPARPFDRERSGINLSEGAGALCLEAYSEGPRPLAGLAGYGLSSDGFHMTGPHPEGDGSFRAMQMALKTAGLEARDIGWVHAHGTGSVQNDLAEGLAVARLFKDRLPWISSTKWHHGHALGAAGAIESVLVIQAMQRNMVLCTQGLENPDERIPVKHPTSNLEIHDLFVLKNTLGFGGANATVIFSPPIAEVSQ